MNRKELMYKYWELLSHLNVEENELAEEFKQLLEECFNKLEE